MVKRLRRRPLTAETGVRFPMGLPKRKDRFLPVLSFWYFLRELHRRAPRGCSRERSDALPRGPLRGFGRFPPRPSLPHGQVFTCPFFLVFSPGIAQARTARLFARAERRSAEGAPPGFRQIPSPTLSPSRTSFYLSFLFGIFSGNCTGAHRAAVRASGATLCRGDPSGVSAVFSPSRIA